MRLTEKSISNFISVPDTLGKNGHQVNNHDTNTQIISQMAFYYYLSDENKRRNDHVAIKICFVIWALCCKKLHVWF